MSSSSSSSAAAAAAMDEYENQENMDAMLMAFAKNDQGEHHEFIVQGACLPLESRRSCELAVECWNLRNSLLEADQSYNATKKDLRAQKYTVKRIEGVMTTLQKALQEKDKVLKEKAVEIEKLKRKVEDVVASRRGIIANYARAETDTKDVALRIARLEVENATLKAQVAEQERGWTEKFNAMELVLTMDARQAEKERDDLDAALQAVSQRVHAGEQGQQAAERKAADAVQRCALLERSTKDLEEKCVWGIELEQAYEALHGKIEVLVAERDAAVRRARALEKERSRIHTYALSEGLQLPSFDVAGDGDEEDVVEG